MHNVTLGTAVLILALFIIIKIRWRKLDKKIDSYYTEKIVMMALPKCRIFDTYCKYVKLVRYGLYKRAYVDKPEVCRHIEEIISTDERYEYKFQHIADFIEDINDVLDDFGCKEKILYSYNRKQNKVNVKFLSSKVESEI